jgi:hypothetical protein
MNLFLKVMVFISICFILGLVIIKTQSKSRIKTQNKTRIKTQNKESMIEYYREDYMNKLNEIDIRFRNTFNWSTIKNQYGVVCLNPSRAQGNCGSCYAFVIRDMIESSLFRDQLNGPSEAKLQQLSVQQIIDCTSSIRGASLNLPCKGCGGCDFVSVLKYFNTYRYICTESSYSYVSYNQTADASKVTGNITLYNYPGCQREQKCGDISNENSIFLPPVESFSLPTIKSSYDLKKVLYNLGPIFWTVNVPENDLRTWRTKIGSVYNGSLAPIGTEKTGHALLIIGWDKTLFSGKFWIIRNSWATGDVYIPMIEPDNTNQALKDRAYYRIYSELYAMKVRRPENPCFAEIKQRLIRYIRKDSKT